MALELNICLSSGEVVYSSSSEQDTLRLNSGDSSTGFVDLSEYSELEEKLRQAKETKAKGGIEDDIDKETDDKGKKSAKKQADGDESDADDDEPEDSGDSDEPSDKADDEGDDGDFDF